MKKVLKRAVAFMLTLAMCIGLTPNMAYAEKVTSEYGMVSGEQNGWDGTTTVNSYVASDYKVTFVLTSYWVGGYNANIEIVNTGTTVIENWCIEFELFQNISNIWNAKIDEKENDCYVIKNAGWNQDIPVGGSVSFGFGVQESFSDFPKTYNLLGEVEKTEKERYEIIYRVENDWKEGFTGSIVIKNLSDKPIEDWSIECEFDNEISTVWNAEIDLHEGNHYVLRNAGYNQNITPNSSVIIGFNVTHGKAVNEMTNFVLSDINSGKVFDILTVSENGLIAEQDGFSLGADFSGLSGSLQRVDEVEKFTLSVYDKNQVLIYDSEIKPMENWSVEEFGLVYGYNRVVFEAGIEEKLDTKELIIYSTTNMYFDKLEIDLSDTDEDGLPNYLETYFGTDIEEVDSDNDGLTDFQELFYFGYDVQTGDSDNDGISDCDEDEDGDGLSNVKEFEIGTDPLDNDSDNDKLLDGEELNLGTSPIMEDTDGDGVNDYDEFRLEQMKPFYNTETGMYTAEFSADTMDIYYDKVVVPTVKLTADADGILSFGIQRVESNYLLNPSMAGYIGAAYEFTTEGVMESAELTFTYDEELVDSQMIASPDFCPTIYYYNSEEGIIEEVEGQVWEGNQVTVKLSHFSTYILVNKADMERLWNETIEVEEGTELTICNHVVFVIDKSGSMPSNDPYYIRTSLIREFCSRLGNNDKIGLVGFSNGAIKYTDGLVNDAEVIETAIAKFESQRDTGGTYMNAAVESAVQMLQNAKDGENAKQAIFILTDGYTSDSLTSAYLTALMDKGMTIYTVGLGSVSESYLKRIAESTGGKYFYAKTSSDLSEVFIDFEETLKNDDLNNDGLNDEITKLICQGKVTTATGTKVFCSGVEEKGWEEIYNEIMKSADYDEDGLINGEEIEIFSAGDGFFVRIKSDPEILDSDCDFYSDYEEVKVMLTNPWVDDYVIEHTDMRYVNDYDNFESGKAYTDYIGKNAGIIFAEYFFDVILCGGKVSINERMRKEVLDFLVTYSSNTDMLDTNSMISLIGNVERGFLDMLPGMELGYDRIQVTKKINETQAKIMELRGVSDSKLKKKELKKYIKSLKEGFGEHVDDVVKRGGTSKWTKFGTKVGNYLAFAACLTENLDNAVNYISALDALTSYESIVDELQYCGDLNVEPAAQVIKRDLNDIKARYKTIAGETMTSALQHGATAGAGFYLTSAAMGLPGLIVDLLWLASDITLGDSLSTRLKNSMAVQTANGLSTVIYKYSNGKLKRDANGKTIVVNSYKESEKVGQAWLANIAGKIWCESKYLDYLRDDSFFIDKDAFLYQTKESEKNAEDNIGYLNELLYK